ncbi:hypothetical protein BC938DRAFT_472241 [Jimgerdemannia flammicorona]|uniref:Uncharacterized protein n=1 Tax=Jimgerdemannia flammicorona TaxID=994334 RepID=A0A433Q6I9_9FUNG|nr:hypothetical protein BC938DRAFT_472241 [Jimgerdemannia flammicorona]
MPDSTSTSSPSTSKSTFTFAPFSFIDARRLAFMAPGNKIPFFTPAPGDCPPPGLPCPDGDTNVTDDPPPATPVILRLTPTPTPADPIAATAAAVVASFLGLVVESSARFHLRQPSKSIKACMQPHSMILRSNHSRLTGLVRKSLQPAARAACLSLSSEDAVSATMITGERKGDCGIAGFGATVGKGFEGSTGEVGVVGVGGFESGLARAAAMELGVDGKTPIFCIRSRRRISLVAAMPSMMGS